MQEREKVQLGRERKKRLYKCKGTMYKYIDKSIIAHSFLTVIHNTYKRMYCNYMYIIIQQKDPLATGNVSNKLNHG